MLTTCDSLIGVADLNWGREFAGCMSMVAFLFLLAPVVVLIAVWIIQWFQPEQDRVPEPLIKHAVVAGGRVEPRFSEIAEI